MHYRGINNPGHPLLEEHAGFSRLAPEIQEEMSIVSKIFSFRVNNFVLNELIDWTREDDPIMKLTFPQKGMLSEYDFERIKSAIRKNDPEFLQKEIREIRLSLNPHPGGQVEKNLANLNDGTKLTGIQHKYPSTVLFFPNEGQTCHAFCTFCFRWPQFVNEPITRFGGTNTAQLIRYLKEHEEVSDVLLTGGDPMVMRTSVLKDYLHALLSAELSHIRYIRIGTKSLSYWPNRFLNDFDSDELINLFQSVVNAGKHLCLVANFNHPRELENESVIRAIKRVQSAGVTIRTQTPLLKGINDSDEIIANLWSRQVELNCQPYYLFITRDTGPRDFFAVPLMRSLNIVQKAKSGLSGLARCANAPVMSTADGKIEVSGITEFKGEKALALQFLKARNPALNGKIIYAKPDEKALWIDDLQPLFTASLY